MQNQHWESIIMWMFLISGTSLYEEGAGAAPQGRGEKKRERRRRRGRHIVFSFFFKKIGPDSDVIRNFKNSAFSPLPMIPGDDARVDLASSGIIKIFCEFFYIKFASIPGKISCKMTIFYSRDEWQFYVHSQKIEIPRFCEIFRGRTDWSQNPCDQSRDQSCDQSVRPVVYIGDRARKDDWSQTILITNIF